MLRLDLTKNKSYSLKPQSSNAVNLTVLKSKIMKFLLSISLIFLCIPTSFSQLQKGFNPQEAKEMIMICNSFTYLDLYKDDEDIIPIGYTKTYTSPAKGMDNVFQVYTHGKTAAINFRGSTANKFSWLANMYSEMLPVEGQIKVKDITFDYKMGNDSKSSIHSGYTLALAFLHQDLLKQIKALNDKGIYDILITGHSQGGALAVLSRAYLAHVNPKDLDPKNTFKVYAFAMPMVGNKAFINEYNKAFSIPEMSYGMINPEDLVPSMPLSYNDSTFIRDNISAMISDKMDVDKSQFMKEGMIILFQSQFKDLVTKFSSSIKNQLTGEYGEIIAPKAKEGINFAQIGNIIKLPPPEYPLELKDSTILENKEFLKTHPRDKNGIFEDKSVYKTTSMNLNHKPYNYYTAILRTYFPKEYDKIDPKSFGL